MSDRPSINHHVAERSFVATVEGSLCRLDYTVSDTEASGRLMTITHTLVPAALEGRGMASALVKAALDFARSEHWHVVPACSYAEAWIRRHADYQDLRA